MKVLPVSTNFGFRLIIIHQKGYPSVVSVQYICQFSISIVIVIVIFRKGKVGVWIRFSVAMS